MCESEGSNPRLAPKSEGLSDGSSPSFPARIRVGFLASVGEDPSLAIASSGLLVRLDPLRQSPVSCVISLVPNFDRDSDPVLG